MGLTNVPVPAGVWTQVHDGSCDAVLAPVGYALAEICQSTSVPPDDLAGLPFIAVGTYRGVCYATKGAPVYVKSPRDVIVVVNLGESASHLCGSSLRGALPRGGRGAEKG